jgi:hypothetical protein
MGGRGLTSLPVSVLSHSQTHAQPRQPVGSRSPLGSESLQALGHDADQRVLPILRQKTVGSLPCRRLAVTGLPESLDLRPHRQRRRPPSERARLILCMPYVRTFLRAFNRSNTAGWTLGLATAPVRAGSRNSATQWNFGGWRDGLRPTVFAQEPGCWARHQEDARAAATPQRTPLVPDVFLRGGACPQPARQGPDGLSLEVGPDCSKMLRDWTGRKLATILFTLVLSRSARASTGGTRRPSDFFRHSHRPAQRVADEDVLAWRGREQLGYSRYLRKKLG